MAFHQVADKPRQSRGRVKEKVILISVVLTRQKQPHWGSWEVEFLQTFLHLTFFQHKVFHFLFFWSLLYPHQGIFLFPKKPKVHCRNVLGHCTVCLFCQRTHQDRKRHSFHSSGSSNKQLRKPAHFHGFQKGSNTLPCVRTPTCRVLARKSK